MTDAELTAKIIAIYKESRAPMALRASTKSSSIATWPAGGAG